MSASFVETNMEAWSGQALFDVLQQKHEEGANVFALCGLGAHHFEGVQTQFTHQMTQFGHFVLVLDALGKYADNRTWLQCLDQFIQEVDRRRGLTEAMEELIAWLHTAQHFVPQSEVVDDALFQTLDVRGRLWQMLCAVVPATLIVLHPEHLDEHARDQLFNLATDYLHDPIAELAPEYQSDSIQAGMMVVMTHERNTPQWMLGINQVCHVDLYEHVESDIRAYLSRRDVLARVIQTTRGDLQQIDMLIDGLDKNIRHMSMHRFATMDEPSRAILSVLSLIDRPIPMRLLMQCVDALNIQTPLMQSIKALIQSGDIRRDIKLGDVQLSLSDVSFGQAISQQFSKEHTQHLHKIIGDTVSKEHGEHWLVMAITHALCAQDTKQVQENGLIAVRFLFVQGEFKQAFDILSGVLEQLDTEDIQYTTALAFKVELCARLGFWRRAIEANMALESRVVPGRGMAELLYRRARLWARINEHEQTMQCLTLAMDEIGASGCDQLRARLMLTRGESSYELGRHEDAQTWATRALEYLSETCTTTLSEVDLTRLNIQGRNLLGKVAIFFSQYEDAKRWFEANLEDAELWCWADESARAQGNLGVLAMQQTRYDEAYVHIKRALDSDMHEAVPRARSLLNIGFIHQHRFEYEDALRSYLEAMRASKQKEELRTYSIATYNVASLYRDLGAFDRAERMLEHINETVNESTRHPFVTRWFNSLLANIYLRQERYDEVISLLSFLEESKENSTVIYGESTQRLRLAEAYLAMGRWSNAEQLVMAVDETQFANDTKLQAHKLTLQAKLALKQDQFKQAENFAESARRLWEQIGSFHDALNNDLTLMLAIQSQDRTSEALALASRLGENILAHARRLPAVFRDNFYTMGLHQTIAQKMLSMGLDVPRALVATVTNTSMVTHDPAWRAWRNRYDKIIGESQRLHQIFRVLDRVAASATPLLILGESGTGKELIAQATHERSKRASKSFIRVNCAAFVDSLLLSELFGHEKGAFTGAVSQKIGRFEMANGGTLFLDEIADISPQTQVALLRVLQEGEFERVGGTQTIHVNVRLVCATNKDLEQLVQKGEFRLDLYYRLKGMIVDVPALRERREDIPRLVEYFAAQYSDDSDRVKRFSPEVLKHLMRYSWPGNIRELQNFVRSVLLFVEGYVVDRDHLAEFEDFFADGEFSRHAPVLEDAWQTHVGFS